MTSKDKDKKKKRLSNAKAAAEKQERGYELTSLSLPKGVPFFNWKDAGNYKLDIVPYAVRGKLKGLNVEETDVLHYEVPYYVHKGINPMDERAAYVCLQRTFGEKCPVCEYVAKISKRPDTDQELIKTLRPKTRQIFAVIDRANRDKGVQIHEGPHFNGLGELIKAKIDAAETDSPYVSFYDPDEGMTLVVSVKKEPSGGSGTFNKPVNLEFMPRKNPIDPDLVDSVNLEAIPKKMTYEELAEIFNKGFEGDDDDDDGPKGKKKPSGDDDDDDDDDPKPSAKKKPKDDDDDDGEKTAMDLGIKVGDKVKHKEHGSCTVTKVSGDGTSLSLEDEDGEQVKAVNPNECTKVKKAASKDEDEDDDDDPKPGKKPSGKKPKDDDDEPLEDEDDDDDDDPKPAKKPGVKKPAKDDDEDDEDDDEDLDMDDEDEDDDEPKKPVRKKPGTKKPKDEDDDD